LLGLFFLAGQLNIPLPGLGQLWPGFIMLGGLLFLADYAFGGRRDSDQVFVGTAALLVGAFFFLFTFGVRVPVPPLDDGVRWADMGILWPVFVLIGGVAFLAQWLAQPGHRGARNMSLIALLVGAVALALNFSAAPDIVEQIVRLWPLLLVAAGLQMLLRAFRRGAGQ
jgi:hypothetical protein